MLKVLGSICVLGTSALLGIQKGAEIQRVYEELLYLQRILYQMQSEIRYLRAPLGDIAGRIGRESRDPYKKWLLSLEREMKQRDGKSFSTLWEQGVRKHLGDLHFPEREISRLCALGSQIVKERIEGGANEKAVWRLFINCPFVCINFDFFWLNKARQLYMDF